MFQWKLVTIASKLVHKPTRNHYIDSLAMIVNNYYVRLCWFITYLRDLQPIYNDEKIDLLAMDTKHHGHPRSCLLFRSTTTSHETIQNKSSQQKLFHKERRCSSTIFSFCVHTRMSREVSKWLVNGL